MERIGLAPGSQIGGYTVVAPLGSGGMGTVYRAVDDGGTAVALKLLHPQIGADAEGRDRLRREVVALQRLRHRSVASVLDAEADSTEAFIVTELVAGANLEDHVRERGPFPLDDLRDLARDLTDALTAVHTAGVVHRDLKPTNVVVGEDGPVLIDFGIAQAAGDRSARVTTTGLVVGTPGYIAPELLDGAEPSPETDLWGLAAVLAFAATGRPPFGTRPLEAVLARARAGDADLDGLGPLTRDALRRALDPDPTARLGADELVVALAVAAVDGDPADGDPADGEQADGDQVGGEQADGDQVGGEQVDGDAVGDVSDDDARGGAGAGAVSAVAAVVASPTVSVASTGDDEPADDEPAEDEPAPDEPAPDEPADDEPAEDEPADDEPADDELASEAAEDDDPDARDGEDLSEDGDEPADGETPTETAADAGSAEPADDEPADDEPGDDGAADDEAVGDRSADDEAADDEAADDQAADDQAADDGDAQQAREAEVVAEPGHVGVDREEADSADERSEADEVAAVDAADDEHGAGDPDDDADADDDADDDADYDAEDDRDSAHTVALTATALAGAVANPTKDPGTVVIDTRALPAQDGDTRVMPVGEPTTVLPTGAPASTAHPDERASVTPAETAPERSYDEKAYDDSAYDDTALANPDLGELDDLALDPRYGQHLADDGFGRGEPEAGDPDGWEPQEGVDWIEDDLDASEYVPDGSGYERPPALRRWGSLLSLAALVGALGALAPVITVGVLVVLLVLVRTAGTAVEAMYGRREQRGVRASDVPRTVVATPWYLVRAVVALVPSLVVASCVTVLVGGAVAWLVDNGTWTIGDLRSGGPVDGGTAALVVASAVLLWLVVVWWGPLSRMTRTGARRVLAVVAPGRLGAAVLVVACVLAAVVVASLVSNGAGIVWSPAPTPTVP